MQVCIYIFIVDFYEKDFRKRGTREEQMNDEKSAQYDRDAVTVYPWRSYSVVDLTSNERRTILARKNFLGGMHSTVIQISAAEFLRSAETNALLFMNRPVFDDTDAKIESTNVQKRSMIDHHFHLLYRHRLRSPVAGIEISWTIRSTEIQIANTDVAHRFYTIHREKTRHHIVSRQEFPEQHSHRDALH